MALPARLFQSLGVPVPAVTENTDTSRPLHESNNIRLYELFDVEFDPSALASGNKIVYDNSSKKFVRVKDNLAAVVAPVDNTDTLDLGYGVGSLWVNTAGAPDLWICTVSTPTILNPDGTTTADTSTWLQLV
jgi:hypothetical protein